MKQINKQIQRLVMAFALLALTVTSCDDAENYYNTIYDIPEVQMSEYRRLFAVGDTMTLIGRLNPQNNLTVTVGNANAEYKVTGKLYEDPRPTGNVYLHYDTIAFPITEAMGSGQLPVTVTSGGNAVNLPAIEIVPPAILKGGLSMKEVTTLAKGDVILYCQNGKGDVYIYRHETRSVEHIAKSGASKTAISLQGISDQHGAWQIHTVYSGGVDNSGKNIWLSARTTEASADNAGNEIYRLLHISAATGTVTTLNRSLYPIKKEDRTLATITPFEGGIGQVKIFQTGGIYPDSKGSIYLRLSNYATCLLENAADPVAAQLSYLFVTPRSYEAWGIPTWRPELPYTEEEAPMPGIAQRSTQGQYFDAENHLMYWIEVPRRDTNFDFLKTSIRLFNLNTRAQLTELEIASARYLPQRYPAGPFGSLTGVQNETPQEPDGRSRDTDLAGFLPMPGNKLMVLYYGNTYTLMDFNTRYAYPYAQSVKVPAPYDLKRVNIGSAELGPNYMGDIGLNYDEEGMIYTTAERRSVILKTMKK